MDLTNLSIRELSSLVGKDSKVDRKIKTLIKKKKIANEFFFDNCMKKYICKLGLAQLYREGKGVKYYKGLKEAYEFDFGDLLIVMNKIAKKLSKKEN